MSWTTAANAPAWIGLDVGGANLKIADGAGRAESVAFPLWKSPSTLAAALRELLSRFPVRQAAGVALSMTGELADCYATKAEGVRAIVAATVGAAQGKALRVVTVDDRWTTPEEATADPQAAAAANWRVAARLIATNTPQGDALWIDAGSTTVDLIPVAGGGVVAVGVNDTERLMAGELVYTGVRRTPVCAVVRDLPYRRSRCPVAAEWFATTADAWLLLGELPEDPSDLDTADGRPFTKSAAVARLARCVCADQTTFNEIDALAVANAVAEEQSALIAAAIEVRPPLPSRVYLSGEGGFLARRALRESAFEGETRAIADEVGAAASRCFPAHAAAVLASLELGGEP